MIRRPRTTAVLVIVAAGALLVIAATQTWATVTLASGGDPLEASGAAAVPVLAPLGLAAVALGLALTVVGPVLRYLLGAIGVMIGGAAGFLAVRAIADLGDAVAGTVTTATGIEGSGVAALVAAITATAWPWLAVAASGAVAGGGVLTLATAARWTRSGRRFEAEPVTDAPPAARPRDTVDSWDDLSRGADPTA